MKIDAINYTRDAGNNYAQGFKKISHKVTKILFLYFIINLILLLFTNFILISKKIGLH